MVSPARAPTSACATGDSDERRPSLRSASVGPTSVNSRVRPAPSSPPPTPEPKATTSAAALRWKTRAARSRWLRRWIFVSRCAWSSFAMWYSAFSLRSPRSRAALMRSAISARPRVSSSSISARSAARPSDVICSGSGIRAEYRPAEARPAPAPSSDALHTREILVPVALAAALRVVVAHDGPAGALALERHRVALIADRVVMDAVDRDGRGGVGVRRPAGIDLHAVGLAVDDLGADDDDVHVCPCSRLQRGVVGEALRR